MGGKDRVYIGRMLDLRGNGGDSEVRSHTVTMEAGLRAQAVCPETDMLGGKWGQKPKLTAWVNS